MLESDKPHQNTGQENEGIFASHPQVTEVHLFSQIYEGIISLGPQRLQGGYGT